MTPCKNLNSLRNKKKKRRKGKKCPGLSIKNEINVIMVSIIILWRIYVTNLEGKVKKLKKKKIHWMDKYLGKNETKKKGKFSNFVKKIKFG